MSNSFAKWSARYFVMVVFGWASLCAQITSMNSDTHSIIGARAAAFADSYVSDHSDVGAMYWNPASLAFVTRATIVANYALERVYGSDNLMTENVVAPIPLDSDWKFAAGFTLSHVGRQGAIGSPLSGMSFHQYSIEAGLAKKLSPAFSLGVLVDGKYGRGSSIALGSATSSFGVFYSPIPGLSYGAVFQGVGWGIEYGVVNGNTIPSRVKLDRSFQMGLSVSIPSRPGTEVVNLSLSNQKVLGVDGIVYKGGIEVIAMNFLALRSGYWVGPNTAAAKFGAGIFVGNFRFDYAASLSELEPRFHEVSLVYVLGINAKP